MSTIITISGLSIDLLRPKPELLTITDIAWNLSTMARFNGATSVTYSVAEHCLYIANELLVDYPNLIRYQGLMHDVPEAYLGDVSKPLKDLLPEYQRIEAVMWQAVCSKFNLPIELAPVIKLADRLAYAIEHYHLRIRHWGEVDEEGNENRPDPATFSEYNGDPMLIRQAFIASYYKLRSEP